MIKIRILSDKLNILKGTGKESGKPYEMHIQTAYAYTVDDSGAVVEIPEKFEFVLPKDADGFISKPLPRGDYTLSPNAIYIDRNGRMSINPRLLPAASAK
mgnify:CR=1 FL=1